MVNLLLLLISSTLQINTIFNVIFTVFKCVRLSTVISLYSLHLIAAPSTVEELFKLVYSSFTVTSTLDCKVHIF